MSAPADILRRGEPRQACRDVPRRSGLLQHALPPHSRSRPATRTASWNNVRHRPANLPAEEGAERRPAQRDPRLPTTATAPARSSRRPVGGDARATRAVEGAWRRWARSTRRTTATRPTATCRSSSTRWSSGRPRRHPQGVPPLRPRGLRRGVVRAAQGIAQQIGDHLRRGAPRDDRRGRPQRSSTRRTWSRSSRRTRSTTTARSRGARAAR